MKSPEQPHKQEGNEMENSSGSREKLQSVIQILKETAERFRALDDEAEILLAKKDTAECTQKTKEKLKERAQLLIDLPEHLSGFLEDVDGETKKEILYNVSCFATAAQEALESEGAFSLGILLMQKSGKAGDKNDLENLIDFLESKQ